MEYSDILIFYSMFLGGCIKLKKRILAIVLSIAVVFSCCCVGLYAYAEKKTIDVNKELLESLLTDRYWVIETLVDGDRSNNPYAEASMMPTQTLMDETLENYQEDEAFKFVVDVLDVYDNPGDYVSDISDTLLSGLMNMFSCDTTEGVFAVLDDIIASKDELRYESVLNEVLQTDYESSWGATLYEENMELEYLKQLGGILKKLPVYQAVLKDTLGIHGTTDSAVVIYDPENYIEADYEIDIETYVNHFLTAYEQDLEAALVNTIGIPCVEGNEGLKKKILASGYLGMVYAYERVVMPEIEYDLDSVYYDGMFDSTMAIMNGAGKVMDIADKTMDYAILMETLQSQKNSTVATMGRMASITSDEDLVEVLYNYADLVNAQGDDLTLEYEVIANYLRNNQTITNFVTKKVTTGMPKLLEEGIKKYGGAKELVLQNKISTSLAKAATIIELAVWIADETTGIKDTAKKIHILKYINKITNEAVKNFKCDLAIYEANKTEENAQAVIDDLEFLKALRLYGEKTAYGSMSAQMESWIGLLLGGGDTIEFLERRYQASVDTYLGCTATPISQNKLELSEGDVLTISTNNFSGNSGKIYTYAVWKKTSGETVCFAEPEYRFFNGIELNGATLRILQASDGFYLPVVDNNKDGAVIEIYCDNVAFGSINNTAEMSIYQKKTGVSYEVIDRIVNTGILNIIGYENSADISVYNLQNTSIINIIDTRLNLVSNAENNDTINGIVNVCGGNAYYENSYFTMGRQTLSGTGTYSDLVFTNTAKKGVKIFGDLSVTNSISNSSTRLVASENITVVGTCIIAGNYFKGNLSFKDYTNPSILTVDGTAYIYNDVMFGDELTLNDSLCLTMSCSTLTLDGDTLVKGDFDYSAGIIVGDGELSIKGDVDITASSPSISYLNFVGSTAQKFDSSNELTVSKLNNTNTSLSGVTFNQKIYVTDTLYSGRSSAYGNGKNVVLTGTAKLDGNTIKGNISAENWQCTDSVEIVGDIYSSGEISFAEGVSFSANSLNHSGGTFTVPDYMFFYIKKLYQSGGTVCIGKNINLDLSDFYKSSGRFTLDESSSLYCSGDFFSKGGFINNGNVTIIGDAVIGEFSGGKLKVKGDINASGELMVSNLIFESRLSQRFKNTSSTIVENLIIENTSKSGFIVNSVINVTNCFNDKSENIVNNENIVLNEGALYLSDCLTKGDLTLSGDFTVKSGEALIVNGDLALNSGANLVVEEGGKVLVKGNLKTTSSKVDVCENGVFEVDGFFNISSSQLNVTEKSTFQVNDYFKSASDDININGDLIIKGDCKITSSTVNADGLITFKGDLITSSGTWNNPNVSFTSKLQQTVSGSKINVNNLTVNNSGKSGITFKSTVNCYGTYDKGNSVITGESYIVDK